MAAASTRDYGYTIGDLSKFPVALDTQATMFQVSNNAETTLVAALQPFSTLATLRDAARFPVRNAVIRIENELIFYAERQENRIFGMARGFAGTSPCRHAAGVPVIAPAIADLHCMIRDAIIRTEHKIGQPGDEPSSDPYTSFRARAEFLRRKWFIPRCLFFTFGRTGHAPLGVQFLDFSYGSPLRWVWEFGDGSISVEQNPYHVYKKAGTYAVGLTIYTADNGVSSKLKQDYVTVLEDTEIDEVLFYANTVAPDGSLLDTLTGKAPLKIRFTDQTWGDISSRIWSFGDGATETSNDSGVFVAEHIYTKKGTYWPSLVVAGGNKSARKVLSRPVKVA